MATSNCFLSPTSKNPRGFSVWCALDKLSAKPKLVVCNYKRTLWKY
jgi:hypothetical protein